MMRSHILGDRWFLDSCNYCGISFACRHVPVHFHIFGDELSLQIFPVIRWAPPTSYRPIAEVIEFAIRSLILASLFCRFVQVKWAPPTLSHPLLPNARIQESFEPSQAHVSAAPVQARAKPRMSVSQRLGFVKAQGQGSEGGSLPAHEQPQPKTLDELMAKQKQVLEQLTSANVTAEQKVELKKLFAVLGRRVKAALDRKQLAMTASALALQPEDTHTVTLAPGRGRGRGRGGMSVGPPILRLDKRPRTLQINDLHQDLRFAGLLKCHFDSFAKVLDVEPVSDDPSKWCVCCDGTCTHSQTFFYVRTDGALPCSVPTLTLIHVCA